MEEHHIKNEKLAPKLVTASLTIIGRLLVLLGKPLFIIVYGISYLAIYIIYITGYFSRITSTRLVQYLRNKLPEVTGSTLLFLTRIFNRALILKSGSKKVYGKAVKKSGIIFDSSGPIKSLASPIKISINLISTNLVRVLTKKREGKKKRLKKLDDHIDLARYVVYRVSKFLYKLNIRHRLIRLGIVTTGFTGALRKRLPKNALSQFKPEVSLPRISKYRLTFYLFTFLFFVGMLAGAFFWVLILKDLPSPDELSQRNIEASTKIYDRNGRLLYQIYKDKNRTPVKLEDIPVQVRSATIAIEDAEFYDHAGFSIKGIVRAIIRNARRKELSGGSTITQQLVKNALLSSEKTYIRKLKELTLAIQVETAYSKNEILEMYLNEVAYGGTAYGVQEAARMYFDKDVGNLTLAEAALLAGLPKSPTEYSPFGTNPDAAKARQKEVLHLMQVNGFITKEQEGRALKEKIRFAENKIDIEAPHFVMYVRQALEDKYGKELVESGGLSVTTTLDLDIQKVAEAVVSEEIEKLRSLNVTNAAVVVLKADTGEVLAMVGSKDYFNHQSDGNVNVAVSPRQPGSSIKVVNYAYALSNGLTPATIVNDSPAVFQVEGQPPYKPRNYEGGYRGNLTVRSALAESRNIPAVKVLASYGVKNMFEMGRKMGITTWENVNNYGLSLTLGGGEVKLIDLARVYATIANYGSRPDITTLLKVNDTKGMLMEEFNCKEENRPLIIAEVQASSSAQRLLGTRSSCNHEQVLDPRVAFMLTSILKDNDARTPSFGRNSLLVIPDHPEVAVKTGTSNNLRDNLTIGYDQDYVVAVWVGNNDNSPMSRVASGVTGASPIFNKIMYTLVSDKQPELWDIPEGLVQLPICPLTGTLACEGCPVKTEWFLEENKPERTCRKDWFKNESKDNNNRNGNDKNERDNRERVNRFRIFEGRSIDNPLGPTLN